ncbi:hypothetical protein EJ04DRAFT_481023 [Polyplosphaeria fusca]|uniref:PIN domain-containing protein n=1 Tax=Polyplosphaeria fusca TaxID=682080 RepID=A0A9P4RDR2_9PLEO|nr:hypothetical protein EJ04DRAFT_481023 [Polyplosphaeria fusca]
MRRNNFPARLKADDARMRVPEQPVPPARKLFNCIVDDTALIAGVKKTTRDGIRKWVSQEAIRLFIPLYTLTALDHVKKGTDRSCTDAREAIKWLDDITSEPTGHVQLEGVDEAYTAWEDVEKFLLPETLLSMEDSDSDEEEDYNPELESSFNGLDLSDETSMSSSHSLDDPPKSPQSPRSTQSSPRSIKLQNGSPFNPKAAALLSESPDRTARNSVELDRSQKLPKSSVPMYLRPLFSHILWRINKESNPDAALESFILLTNDAKKHGIAQKFGIRAKRLEQLRDAVGREDREYKNRLTVYKMETESVEPAPVSEKPAPVEDVPTRPKSSHSKKGTDSDDDTEVLLKRAPRGPQAQNGAKARVWDPNDFGRANQNFGGRGRGHFNGPRGRGAPRGGRGAFAPRGAYVAPAPPFRAPPAPRVDPNQPIDPDSFARPMPRANTARGNRRKLWEPI